MAEQQCEIDLGNLMAFDPHHQFISPLSSREDVVKEAIEEGRRLVQAVADALFSLPSTEDPDGPIVKLPPPTTKLPREKPVSVLLAAFLELKKEETQRKKDENREISC